LTTSDSIQRDLGARIRDTFVAPTRLAEQVQGVAPWLDVLLISTLVAVVAVATLPDEVFVEQMRDAVTRRGQPVDITSPPALVARWGRYLAMLATIATHPILAFTVAGGITVLFSIVGGGRGTYRDFLSLTAHASLIPALGSVAAIAVRLAAGIGADATWTALLPRPAEAPNLIAATLLGVDPFILWMLVVIAVGATVLDPRRSRMGASLLLIGVYVTLLLTSTALLHPELRDTEAPAAASMLPGGSSPRDPERALIDLASSRPMLSASPIRVKTGRLTLTP